MIFHFTCCFGISSTAASMQLLGPALSLVTVSKSQKVRKSVTAQLSPVCPFALTVKVSVFGRPANRWVSTCCCHRCPCQPGPIRPMTCTHIHVAHSIWQCNLVPTPGMTILHREVSCVEHKRSTSEPGQKSGRSGGPLVTGSVGRCRCTITTTTGIMDRSPALRAPR